MTGLLTTENLIALLTLTGLEIVLGIDNIIFISILAGKLPMAERKKARLIGLSLALIARVALLLGISWVMKLTRELFTVLEQGISGKDIILILGGLFLVGKSTYEIHHKLDGEDASGGSTARSGATLRSIVLQIIVIDLVFSLDSVITAVGMAKEVAVMVMAVMIAIGVMMAFAGMLGEFIERNPALKILALAFLILIGVMLVAEGLDQHVNKGYIYFAMAFSLCIEFINMRLRKTRDRKRSPGDDDHDAGGLQGT